MLKGPETIKTVLEDVVSGWMSKQDSQAAKIESAWKKAAGSRLCRHTCPITLKKRQLLVKVDSSSWFFELNTNHKEKLLKRLQAILGEDLIGEIIFKVRP